MMRRHAACFRLATTEDDADRNDDLWALHRKYNRVDSSLESKNPSGPEFCVKAKQAVTGSLKSMANLKLTGRSTIGVISLMFLVRFPVLENPVETFSRVVSQKRKVNVRKTMDSLRDRFRASESRRWDSPLGLTSSQLDAYTLAPNLSESHEAVIMPSMWDGWRRMALARGMPAKTFQATVDAALRTWAELVESLDADDLAAQTSGSGGWPWSSYPKFPRRPGYAITCDGAAFITRQYKDKSLELFRVESVAMANWVDLYQRQYLHRVNYMDDPAFLNKGCKSGYAIAHSQNLQQMLCLWKRLQNLDGPLCCNNLVAANEGLEEAKAEGTG